MYIRRFTYKEENKMIFTCIFGIIGIIILLDPGKDTIDE